VKRERNWYISVHEHKKEPPQSIKRGGKCWNSDKQSNDQSDENIESVVVGNSSALFQIHPFFKSILDWKFCDFVKLYSKTSKEQGPKGNWENWNQDCHYQKKSVSREIFFKVSSAIIFNEGNNFKRCRHNYLEKIFKHESENEAKSNDQKEMSWCSHRILA